MNTKRCFLAFVAAFIFMFVFEFVWHGLLMKSSYMELPALWRNEPIFPLLILGQLIIAFFFVAIYCRGFAGSGVAGGVRLGILLAFMHIGASLIQIAVQPLTTKIVTMWAIGGLLEFAIMGAIVGAVYKPGVGTTT
jgi:hypothetical protein